MARLEMSRDNRTKEYELGDNTLLGRKSDCTICVPSPKASREHCRIVKSNGRYVLEDLGASNGTILNGSKIAKQVLKHKDEISIGGVLFRFLEESNDPLVGTRLGKYEIIEKVGVGGMGIVYRARQITLGRIVALKVMNKKLASQESFIQSFEREAKIAARLQHQNIIGIHDFGYEDGWYYFSMEFIEGENLLDLTQRQGALTTEECLPYAIQVAEALAHAHSHHVLHKDIKPQNIMITHDNIVKLADMGLASLMHQEKDENVGDQPIMATPQYVPPEIIRRRDADQRSDIYSFAATLFHVITGRVPYEASDIKELLKMHLNAPVPDPREINPKIPEALAEFVMKGLSKDPVARQQSAEECLQELRAIPVRRKTVVKPLKAEASAQARRRTTGSAEVEKTLKLQRVAAENPGFDLRARLQAFGWPKIAVIAGGVLVLAIAVFAALQENPEAEAALLWQKLEAQLNNPELSDIEEEELQKSLYQITDNEKFRDTTFYKKAESKLAYYKLSRVTRRLQTIKNGVADRLIDKKKAITELRDILLNGVDLSAEERKNIADYLVSIGGDPDTRPEWEKEYTKLIDNGELLAAMKLAAKAWEEADGNEKSKALTLLEEVKAKMEIAAAAEKTQADALFQEQKYREVMGGYIKTRKMFHDEILHGEDAGLGMRALILVGKIVQAMSSTMARGWQDFSVKAADGDFAGCAGIADALNTQMMRYLRADNGARLQVIANGCQAFEQAILKNAKEKTKLEINYVRVMLEGKERKVAVDGRNGKLFAIGRKKEQEISLKDINIEDLSIIVPASRLTAEEALGGMVYNALRNNEEAIDKYKIIAEGKRDLRPAVADALAYISGIIPVFSLADWTIDDDCKANCNLENGELQFFAPGEYENFAFALPLHNLDLTTRIGNGVTLKLFVNPENYLAFTFADGKIAVTAAAQGHDKQQFEIANPQNGEVFFGFHDNGVELKTNTKVLGQVALQGCGDWHTAVIFQLKGKVGQVQKFAAAIRYPELRPQAKPAAEEEK